MTDASDVKQRWKEYFEWLLTEDDRRRVVLTESGLVEMHELLWKMLERQ